MEPARIEREAASAAVRIRRAKPADGSVSDRSTDLLVIIAFFGEALKLPARSGYKPRAVWTPISQGEREWR